MRNYRYAMDLSKKLHPAVYRDILTFKGGLYRPHPVQGSPDHQLLTKVMTQHGAIWMKEYGRGFWGGMISIVCLFGAVLYWMSHTTSSLAPLAMPVSMALVAVFGGLALAANRRKVTALELRNFLPVLGLSPVRQAYCEALLNVEDCSLIDRVQKEEIRRGLNELMDADCRFEKQLNSLAAATGGNDLGRIAELERRLGETTDPEAKAALEQALDQAGARSLARRKLEPLEARVNAQKELLVQTIRSISENVARLNLATQSAPALDLDDLRRSVEEVEEQTNAVERAVQELGAG